MKTFKKYFVLCLLTVSAIKMQAQYCSNPTDTVYGLTASGRIVPILDNTGAGVPSPNRDSTGTGFNANGLGFSSLNGSFYFFNRCAAGPGPSADSTQFVRYIPSTKTTVILADPPATFLNSDKIRSGCMNNSGSGYYTLNPGGSGVAILYYYSVGTGLWTTITQTFKNRSGVTIQNVGPLNSGDMAFDGIGNLWLLSSSSSDYTLYKVTGPIPTTATANLVVDTIIIEKPTPNGSSITGVCFNAAGKMYLSTGSGTAVGRNKFYELATATGVVTLKGSLLAGYGDDLTSCSYPLSVLPVIWVNFTAAYQTTEVQLVWTANEKENVSGYTVEFSTDAEHWQTVQHIQKDNTISGTLKTYRYIHHELNQGNNYYRIAQVSTTGEKTNSSIKFVNTREERRIYIGPNPTKDIIYIYNRNTTTKYMAQVYDKTGRLAYSVIMDPAQPSINIGHLPKGLYVLKLSSSAVNEAPATCQFIKW